MLTTQGLWKQEDALRSAAGARTAADATAPVEVAIAFGAAVYAAMGLTRTENFVAALWPANGLLLAGLLMARDGLARRQMLALSFAANIVACLAHKEALWSATGYSLANTAETVIAYQLLKLARFRSFTRVASFVRFIFICGLVAPLAPSMFGALVISLSFDVTWWSALQTWFPADSLGLLVVTPVVCLLSQAARTRRSESTVVVAGYHGALVAVTAVVFLQTKAPLLFVVCPLSALIAMRLGPRHAAFSTLMITAIALVCTYMGRGPAALMHGGDSLKVSVVQLFCLVNLLLSISIAAAVAERDASRRHAQRVSRRARHDKNQLLAALNSMTQGVCLFGPTSQIVMCNDRFLEIYGLRRGQARAGQSFAELISVCEKNGIAPETGLAELHETDDRDQRLSNGRLIHISQSPMPDGSVICTYTDVTAERAAEETLLHRTLHDVLTGLPNRRLLIDRIDKSLAGAQGVADMQGRSGGAVLLLDVDHFKTINDTFGHAAGDAVLKIVASRLAFCVREEDTVARLGGDEFAILISASDTPLTGDAVAQRILEKMRTPISVEGHEIQASMSIGIASFASGRTTDELLKAADIALYEAKRAGRNGFAAFTAAVPNSTAA